MKIFALEFIGADEDSTMYHAVSHAALIRKMVFDVQLYLQRARATIGDLSGVDSPTLADICHHEYAQREIDSFELFMELAEQGDIACVKAHPTYKYYDVAEIEVAE
jgi:hypothetical protein